MSVVCAAVVLREQAKTKAAYRLVLEEQTKTKTAYTNETAPGRGGRARLRLARCSVDELFQVSEEELADKGGMERLASACSIRC